MCVLVVYVHQSGPGELIATQLSDLTLSYISPQCSAVSPREQVAWIIDASTMTEVAHGKDICCIKPLSHTFTVAFFPLESF